MVKQLTLPIPWSKIQPVLKRKLEENDLVVLQSFDLQSARNSLPNPEHCPCPSHGTSSCTCQYVVYIVHHIGKLPLSLVVHGYDDETYVSVATPTDVPADESTLKSVQLALDQLARLQLTSLP